jgi:co-chaperonin GroES (HSP10)
MNIKPLRDNIIIVKEEKSLTTSSGIILKTNDEADRARVVAIGPDVVDVQVNDLVIVNWNKAQIIDRDNFRINVLEVIGVLED